MGDKLQESVPGEQSSMQVILIVEDEEEIGDFIVRLLEQETPYKALAVMNAIEALELVCAIKPNLFILDYQLPGINGLELFDLLRAMKGLESVPALMFSASTPSRRALQERKLPFLTKPFELDNLLQAIENLLTQEEGSKLAL
jgi:CheY-like chemotaxis protein